MFKRLRDFRIVPHVNLTRINDALNVAEALVDANLPVMELNFRKHSDSKIIKAIRDKFPEFYIGAGGILNRDLLLRVMDTKSCFALSPGVNPETVAEANKNNYQFAPGVCTPSDIEFALLNGSVNFQFFPAELSGGPLMINAFVEAFGHLKIEFLAKGGITLENMKAYLDIPQVAAVSLDWIADQETIQTKNWQKITENAVKALKEAGK